MVPIVIFMRDVVFSWQPTNMKVSMIYNRTDCIIYILGAGLAEPLPAAAAWPRLGILSPWPPAQGRGPGAQDICSGLST